MSYHISRHIWLQGVEDRILAQNVLTGRRALLNPQELDELEAFCGGLSLKPASRIHQRLVEADLIHRVGSELPSSQRFQLLERRVIRYLTEHLHCNRRTINQHHRSFQSKLHRLRQVLDGSLTANYTLDEVSRKVARDDLEVVLDHVETFVHTELEASDQTVAFGAGFLKASAHRPLPREDYEQQPCLPETSQRRISFAEPLLSESGKCLILGDDDLLSICWGQRFKQECHVFELDEALLRYLPPHLQPNVTLYARDLTEGLPQEFRGQYELIYTDPMYERTGMDLFLKCCAEGLSHSPTARVLFTTRPDMIDDGHLLEERLASVGLVIEQRLKNFSRYRLPDFYRRKLVRGFYQAGISSQLVDGLCQIPYLYADLFVLKKRT